MKIFALTANWWNAPLVIVIAEDSDRALQVSQQGVSNLLPWNIVTVKELWSFELKDTSLEEKVVAVYKNMGDLGLSRKGHKPDHENPPLTWAVIPEEQRGVTGVPKIFD